MAKKEKAPQAAAEGGEGAPKKKRGLVGTLILFGGPVLALLLIAGGAYFFLFAGEEPPPEGEHGEVAQAGPAPTFMDLPDMLVNLTAAGGQRAVLKLAVALELKAPEAVPQIEAVMPRVIDNFQVFLRELRVEDLSGSAGMFRLKEELVRRVNLAVAPVAVRDVLFKEMLIQ
jgi:flagellar FliL protein